MGGLKLPDIRLTGEENPEKKTSPRELVPNEDRTRARCVTSADATACSTDPGRGMRWIYIYIGFKGASTSKVIGARNEMMIDDNDGQMIFGDLVGLKLPDICLTGEEKPRKNLTQETCPDRGSNPGPLRDRRACYRLLHRSGSRDDMRWSFFIEGTSKWIARMPVDNAWRTITRADEMKWMRWVWRNGGMKFVVRENGKIPTQTPFHPPRNPHGVT